MANSTSKQLSLDPSQAAVPAIAQGLLKLFEIMEQNEEGVIERIDPEFLHDFRIAIRRTRTVLSKFNAIFPSEVKAFEDNFSWLGKLTGPPRDHDVLILEIEKLYKSRLKKPHDTLPELLQFLRHRHDEMYAPLVDALQSQKYGRFKTNWRQFLKNCIDQPAQVDDSAPAISHIAPKKIWDCYTRILRLGTRIRPGSAASDYHRLRKAAKKLRYLLEYFRSLYPARDIMRLIRELKKFQDNLGEHQDLEVHIVNLTTCRKEIQKQPGAPADLPETIEWICRRFEKRKLKLRKEFLTRFEDFSAKAYKNHYKALFHRHVQ